MIKAEPAAECLKWERGEEKEKRRREVEMVKEERTEGDVDDRPCAA
jgi:hypothetical protein